MRKIRNTITVATLAIVTAAISSVVAFASETEENTYAYTKGQLECEERHSKFAKVSDFATDEEREAYFAEQGIGKAVNPYCSDDVAVTEETDYGFMKGRQRNLVSEYDGKSVEERLTDGSISKEEAELVKAEAHIKHNEIHARFSE